MQKKHCDRCDKVTDSYEKIDHIEEKGDTPGEACLKLHCYGDICKECARRATVQMGLDILSEFASVGQVEVLLSLMRLEVARKEGLMKQNGMAVQVEPKEEED